MSTFTLRDYQAAAADAVEEKWKKHQSTLCVLPTGCGKTVLFAEIIRRRQPGRALVIAHREELIVQAVKKIEAVTGLEAEVEMAEQVASNSLFHKTPVVVASIQTLVSGGNRRRMERFRPEDFDTIVVDEFHHATAASYRAVLEYFLRNEKAKLLGVTATPDRADQAALGLVCESVAFDYEVRAAIDDGWLVPVEQQMVTIDGLDYSQIHTTAGDLNSAELASVMEQERVMHGTCAATIEIAGSRQTILFTSSVKQAEMACNILNRHRAGIAQFVCGATDREERRKIMRRVLDGSTQILCNVGVATEGFDAPGVEVIVMGRPTKSRALYAQMAGRATRPLPGVVDGPATPAERRAAIAASAKKACLLVDFVGNSGRHKLMTATDILGGDYSEEVKDLALLALHKAKAPRNVCDVLAEKEQLVAQRKEEAERRRREEEERRRRLVVGARFTARKVDPFDAFDVQPVLEESDRSGKELSPKQRALLINKIGIDPDTLSYANARKLIDAQFYRWNNHLCSLKQATVLKRYGFETGSMSFDRAAQLITAIQANHWKLPPGLSPITQDHCENSTSIRQ
ncbi:type III restriction protein res subunit [Chthoniobacter flavus Ellin428]|uniref:Type III restriction protein res subunit n=1 Tax=Chthoniobacter flavus Ellin428 TaxID=497964 RepID=B4D2R4_9BACT|nr:DEAD/DEAH box helicase [Chthoniobacter flavus]EDY19025.1 type III restriction protein res subunit [Chthoniobacter flavus Ellin428]TCO86789.1 superfamily II DNA or RNA helicase [Chthoniobacter flavus]